MTQRVVLPTNVSPKHYKLEITPNLTDLTFSGVEDVDVVVYNPTCEISLHCKEIVIKEVTFTNKSSGSSPEVVEISYKLKQTIVCFTFDKPLELGEGVLHITYDGILNGDMAGFYKSGYTDADGKKQIMASTQFEALDARRALPCWDEPAVKATFALVLIVPAELTAISNMPELTTTHLPNGKKRVIFDVSPKMSTYLLAWAIGQFDFVQAKTKNGVTIRVFSPPGRADHGRFALDVGCRALDFYDEYFNVRYPLPKLDMICCTEFAMGAMENWGLVTYREVDLMIDEKKASSQQKQRVAIVVTHELAHQWFGNLVTMEWWEDLWLNEGFAAFMEHFATDELFPDYKIWEQYTTDAMGAAQRLDALRSSHPIQVPIAHAEEVEQVFDAISYCKGSTVVRMVSAILGPDKFRKGLQLYMQKFQYGNTVTLDLWNCWSEVSGVDIPAVMATWTQQMGYPYLVVKDEKWTDSNVTITLEQNWFLADGSGKNCTPEESKLWNIPLLFSTSNSSSGNALIMSEKSQVFSIPLNGPNDWLKINAGQQALARVASSRSMIDRIQSAISTKALPPIDRAALLLDAYALAKSGDCSVEEIVNLLRAYVDEDNNTVWGAISGALRGLHVIMESIGGEAFEAFTAFGANMVKNALNKVGWTAKPTDGHSEKLLRSTVIGLLDCFGSADPQVYRQAKELYDAHWSDNAVLSSDFKTTVYKIILKNGGLTEYEQILKTYYNTDDNSERKFAMHSLGAVGDEKLKLRTLDWAVKSGDVKLQDFFYPIGSVGGSASGAELAWRYFQENLGLIRDMLAKASPSLMDTVIVSCISRFSTKAKADEIEAFFAANPLPKSARRIEQTVEAIRNNGTMVELVKQSRLVEASFW